MRHARHLDQHPIRPATLDPPRRPVAQLTTSSLQTAALWLLVVGIWAIVVEQLITALTR